jgi:hypothetical protein
LVPRLPACTETRLGYIPAVITAPSSRSLILPCGCEEAWSSSPPFVEHYKSQASVHVCVCLVCVCVCVCMCTPGHHGPQTQCPQGVAETGDACRASFRGCFRRGSDASTSFAPRAPGPSAIRCRRSGGLCGRWMTRLQKVAESWYRRYRAYG